MRTMAVGLALVVLAGCDGTDAGREVPIEQAAWSAAGVDEPAIGVAGDGVLEVRVETSLPVDDTDDRGAGFAERAVRIVWRTTPGRFDRLVLTVAHDGLDLVTVELDRADLEERLGPRPAGLDDGVARSPVTPDEDGAFAGLGGEDTVSAALAEIVEPVIGRTLEEFFESGSPGIELGERDACFGGLNGDRPTGEYRAGAVAGPIPVDGSALATLPPLADYWRSLGLDVNTATLDTGLDSIQASIDDRATVVAKASDAGVSLSGNTRCLEPD